MGFFKTFFGMKEIVSTPVEPKPVEVIATPEQIRGKCDCCQNPVYINDKYSKQIGKYYHRRCWKNLVKQTWAK